MPSRRYLSFVQHESEWSSYIHWDAPGNLEKVGMSWILACKVEKTLFLGAGSLEQKFNQA